jgi:hypothetical protein
MQINPHKSHFKPRIIYAYINPYPANVENMVSFYNASKWQTGFNSAFKELINWVRIVPFCVTTQKSTFPLYLAAEA